MSGEESLRRTSEAGPTTVTVARRRRGAARSGVALLAALLVSSPLRDASALVWPDVAERIERDLGAADPATRRAAAHDLAALGVQRASPLVLAALSDPDDDVRLAAADAAIRLRVEGATDAVTGWLNAPDARLRRRACDVARTLPSPRAVAPLARTLGDPDADVRGAAADALGRQVPAEAVPPLLGRLDDPAPAVRVQVVMALARLGDARAVVPLVGKVQDSAAEVRQAVARALGDLADVRASAALVLALRDQSEDVRREALAALGRLRAVDAVDSIEPFVSDRNATLRAAALAALGRIGSPDAVRVLVGALGAGDDLSASLERSSVRDALVAAGPAALGPLHAVLAGTPSPSEASGAAWVLGALHAHGEAPAIVAALRRGALAPAAALHALAGAGSAAQVPVVLEYLSDPSPTVRSEALGAAAALLDPDHPDGRAVEPLGAALLDAKPSAAERARIAALLGRTGAPRAAPLLVDLARTGDPGVRLAAIDALGLLGRAGSGADDVLLEALQSPEAPFRLHAAVALGRTGDAVARDRLLGLLDRGDEEDRAAILTAAGGVLERAPTDAAVEALAKELGLAAGPERDAVLEAIGRAPLPSAVRALEGAAREPEADDRRQAAILLAGHPDGAGTLRALLADDVPSVRAQAAWSLGTIGAPGDVPRLNELAGQASAEAAADAAAAIGRIAARAHDSALAARTLCPHASDPRPYVRADALAGLALAGSRCGDGALERSALALDPSEDVRAAAVRALDRTPREGDGAARERCARVDPSGTVAALCRVSPARPERTRSTLIYVLGDLDTTPRPGAPYALLLADGTLRLGTTDRRGAVFDPVAPEGELSLRPVTPPTR